MHDVVAVAKLAGIRNYNPLIDNVREEMMSFSERVKEFPLESNTTKLIAREIEENVSRLG